MWQQVGIIQARTLSGSSQVVVVVVMVMVVAALQLGRRVLMLVLVRAVVELHGNELPLRAHHPLPLLALKF